MKSYISFHKMSIGSFIDSPIKNAVARSLKV